MHHKKREPKKYIHYGSDSFDINYKPKWDRWDKPSGFWSSPVNCDWGWKDFLENENWRLESLDKSFVFHLKPHTKILKVKTMKDVYGYLKPRNGYVVFPYQLDCDKLRRDFDGLELFFCKKYNFHDTELFYSWDCDSLVLWNMNAVVVDD